MDRTRRIVRIHLDLLLLLLLPFGGFLYSVSSHLRYVGLLAFVCAVLAICIECLNQLTLRDRRRLGAQLKADRREFDEWTEKVKELDHIVTQISKENEESRQKVLGKPARGRGTTA